METYICEYCNKDYKRKRDLTRHLFQKHDDKIKIIKIPCSYHKCSNTIDFQTIGNTIKDIYDKPYCSKECGKIANVEARKSRTSKVRYKCSYCRNEYVDKKLFDKHLEEIHFNNTYKCQFCKVTYKSIEKLHQHYREKHLNKKIVNHVECESPKCKNEITFESIGTFNINKKRFCSNHCARVFTGTETHKKYKFSYERREKLTKQHNGTCKWYSYVDSKGIKHRVQGSYEYAFAKKLDELNIDFISHPKGIKYLKENNKETYYFPDFYIPSKNLYVDTKSTYYLEKSCNKFKIIRDQYPELNLVILTEQYLEAFGINLQEIHKYIE